MWLSAAVVPSPPAIAPRKLGVTRGGSTSTQYVGSVRAAPHAVDRASAAGSPAGTTRGFGEPEFRQIADWITEVVDGLAQNGEDGNGDVEAKVKAQVEAMCQKFPLYPDL